MSKLIVQGFLSLMVSLGLVAGARPDVRGEVKRIWQETKAVLHQTFEFATGTVHEVTSQIPTEVTVDLGLSAGANAGAGLDASSNEAQAEGEGQTDGNASADSESEDGFLLNFGGNANADLSVGVGLGK